MQTSIIFFSNEVGYVQHGHLPTSYAGKYSRKVDDQASAHFQVKPPESNQELQIKVVSLPLFDPAVNFPIVFLCD